MLGNGLDIIYPPENLDLYRRIAEGGAVVAEFPFGRRADRQSFAMRNRIISGICEAVVVVESDVDGGAMITARFAGEHGRLIFAVPGRIDQPSSRGCHQLIRDGATLLTGVDDILAELNYLDGLRPAPVAAGAAEVTPPAGLSETEQRVLECFRGGSNLTIDALTGITQLPAHELGATLMLLELRKLVVKRVDGTFEASGGA